MQRTKSELIKELSQKGIKASTGCSKAQLIEMLEFAEREEVKRSAPSDEFIVAPNGMRFSRKTAQLAGLI